MHPESGPCLSVQGCKLPLAVLSQDEACRLAHETVQAKVERRLPNLQTAYCTLLLPREDVSGGKMSCPVLPEHQAEVAPATDAAETSECRYDEAKNGTNECAESKHKQLGRGKCASKEHRKFIDASTTAAATTTTTMMHFMSNEYHVLHERTYLSIACEIYCIHLWRIQTMYLDYCSNHFSLSFASTTATFLPLQMPTYIVSRFHPCY